MALDAADAVPDDVYPAVSVADSAIGATTGDVGVHVVGGLLLVGGWGGRRWGRNGYFLPDVFDCFVDVLVFLVAGVWVNDLVDVRLVVVADGALRVAVLVAIGIAETKFSSTLQCSSKTESIVSQKQKRSDIDI